MGQATRSAMPLIKNKEQARAFVLRLGDRERILLKDQLHDLDKREVIQYLQEEYDEVTHEGKSCKRNKSMFEHRPPQTKHKSKEDSVVSVSSVCQKVQFLISTILDFDIEI